MEVVFAWWLLIGCVVTLLAVLVDDEVRDPRWFGDPRWSGDPRWFGDVLPVVVALIACAGLWPVLVLLWVYDREPIDGCR